MRNKLFLIASIAFAIVVVIAATWYRVNLATPAARESKPRQFKIAEQTPTAEIADDLQAKGLIKSPLAFLIYVKTKGLVLKSGLYSLDPSSTIPAIAQTIGQGRVSEYRITIPEGWRTEQIAQLLQHRGIASYGDFMTAAAGKEGRLFPDTYRIGLQETAADIVAKLQKNYDRRLTDAGIQKLAKSDLTLASIVEREAKHDEDRPKMAGVYKNRLAIGMALEADPTTQYAVDSVAISQLRVDELPNYEFWEPISSEQNRTFESPFNTYRRTGLPPGPISNPGIKSIQAVLNPDRHEFFYFFNLKDGTTIYSKTREEHDANRRQYGT